ncbi:MAG: hypothetical protein Alis3KO_16720 [Aliiglaciecola sp.]
MLLKKITFFISALLSINLSYASYPPLPEPVSNNAVAFVKTEHGDYLVSMMGLGAGRDYKDIHNKVWALKIGENSWQQKTSVPSSLPLKGRLASVAVGIKQHVYLFGGYTVAADHTEISSPDNFKYDVVQDNYIKLAAMPVAVDDAVALVYRQRYIYLISGWHNDGNVNLVQVYDTQTDSWRQASPFLGKPVFGHAGAISVNKMVVCDGVAVVPEANKRRGFAAESACYIGTITDDIYKIDWRTLPHPTGTARYRMAATHIGDTLYFAGGSDNPYNYNGIGYDGQPSKADNQVWIFNLDTMKWNISSTKASTMDHRGLINDKDQLLIIGGMGKNQQVLNTVTQIKLSDLE